MEERLVSFQVAKLAKEKKFDIPTLYCYEWVKNHEVTVCKNEQNIGSLDNWNDHTGEENGYNLIFYSAPTQSLLQKFIREKRGVHIEIHRNASGYYWSMCKEDGGTDLGWSGYTGPNLSGVWDSFEGALENALQVQLSYDLPNDITIIKHWGNYVEFALKSK